MDTVVLVPTDIPTYCLYTGYSYKHPRAKSTSLQWMSRPGEVTRAIESAGAVPPEDVVPGV